MSFVNNLKKLVHRKTPEFLAPLAAGSTVAGGFLVSDKSDIIPDHNTSFYIGSASSIWRYNADADGWQNVPASGLTGTFAAGACGEFRAVSAPGGIITQSATAGTTTTITTSISLATNLVGKRILITEGPNAGAYLDIVSNTIGANAVITVPVQPSAFTSSTKFRFYAGSLWFFNSGTAAVGFGVYDVSTNAWTARSVVGIPTPWGTDAQLVSTGALMSNEGNGFDNATATSGSSTTIACTTKSWPTNGWANYEVRILSGTGAGQIRSISSNTSTILTVSSAWVINPDNTSVFAIFGNSDYFYLLGNNAVTLYRFSIASNTWSTITPGTARSGAAGAGFTADWIDSVQDVTWTNGSYGSLNVSGTLIKQLGRYIYSFRGGATNVLDIYDIASNTWINAIPYGSQSETFTTGSCSTDIGGMIYIQKEATGRIFVFDVADHILQPFATSPMPQGTAVAGDKMIIQTYREGSNIIRWLYSLSHSRNEFVRWLII